MRQKQVYSCECTKQFILVLLFITYWILFHKKNCKPTFAPPCICISFLLSYGLSFHFLNGIIWDMKLFNLMKFHVICMTYLKNVFQKKPTNVLYSSVTTTTNYANSTNSGSINICYRTMYSTFWAQEVSQRMLVRCMTSEGQKGQFLAKSSPKWVLLREIWLKRMCIPKIILKMRQPRQIKDQSTQNSENVHLTSYKNKNASGNTGEKLCYIYVSLSNNVWELLNFFLFMLISRTFEEPDLVNRNWFLFLHLSVGCIM